MSDDPCCRVGCGHDVSSHDSEVGYCEECACTGFVEPDTEDAAIDWEEIDSVAELNFDDGDER